MFTEAKIATDEVIVTPTTFALGVVPNGKGRCGFTVEEQEMLTELEFVGTLSSTVADQPVDLTLFVDGVDQADLVDGMVTWSAPHIAGQGDLVNLTLKKRFAKGAHVAELRVRAAAGNVTVLGLLRPAKMRATRWSFNSINAPQANSKQVAGAF